MCALLGAQVVIEGCERCSLTAPIVVHAVFVHRTMNAWFALPGTVSATFRILR